VLRVHHLNNSRSQRVLWLCEELGIPYEIVKHSRDPATQRAPQSLAAIHPLGKAPAVEHHGQVIVESEAILEYICQVCGEGRLSRSPDAPDYAAYLTWLAFPEGTLFPGLVVDLVYAWTGGGNESFKGFFDAEIDRNLAYVEASLAGRETLLPSGFTAADINLGWALEFAECRGRLLKFPALTTWLNALRARPAYVRAIETGGRQDLSVFATGAS